MTRIHFPADLLRPRATVPPALERHLSKKARILDALVAGATTAPEIAKASGLAVRDVTKYMHTMRVRGFVKVTASAKPQPCPCCGMKPAGRPGNVYALAVGK